MPKMCPKMCWSTNFCYHNEVRRQYMVDSVICLLLPHSGWTMHIMMLFQVHWENCLLRLGLEFQATEQACANSDYLDCWPEQKFCIMSWSWLWILAGHCLAKLLGRETPEANLKTHESLSLRLKFAQPMQLRLRLKSYFKQSLAVLIIGYFRLGGSWGESIQ